MKKTILYCRVSSDEQRDTGYSLDYQEERLIEYCRKNDIQPVVTYREDASGKTIDKRPELKRAIEFAKKNKHDIDYFIVLKWDRFARSAHDAFVLIRLFDGLGIGIQAIEQPINFAVPEQLILLGVYLTAPESDNIRRSMNIKTAIHKARKSGRYCSNNPWGYKYAVDQTKRKILIPDENAPAVRDLFEKFASGIYSLEAIRVYAAQRYGRKFSKNYFKKNFFINPLYAGLVRVSKTTDEPEQTIPGEHEAIVDVNTFQTVQAILSGRKRAVEFIKYSEKFPLRGVLICPDCGKLLTGSSSRGKRQLYDYYHCRDGCKTRYGTDRAESAVISLLQTYRLDPAWVEIAEVMIGEHVDRQNVEIKTRISDLTNKLKTVETSLLTIDEKYINGSIGPDSYERLKRKYDQDKANLLRESAEIRFTDRNFMDLVHYTFNLLKNIDKFYIESDIQVKPRLLCSIFPGKVIFDGLNCRTPEINPALLTLFNRINILRVTKKGISNISSENPLMVDENSLLSNTFIDGLKKIYGLKQYLKVG